jgi:hypothetical protein
VVFEFGKKLLATLSDSDNAAKIRALTIALVARLSKVGVQAHTSYHSGDGPPFA